MEIKLDEKHSWIFLLKEFKKKSFTNLANIRVDPGQTVQLQWTLNFENDKKKPFWLQQIEWKIKIKE